MTKVFSLKERKRKIHTTTHAHTHTNADAECCGRVCVCSITHVCCAVLCCVKRIKNHNNNSVFHSIFVLGRKH